MRLPALPPKLKLAMLDLFGGRLSAQTLRDGVIYPARYGDPIKRRISDGVQAGVRDADGRAIADSGLTRNFRRVVTVAPGVDAPERDARRVIYAGTRINHFGHFLLESLCRLWCAPDFPDHALAFAADPDDPRGHSLSGWQRALIDRLAGPREVLFIHRPTRFAEVVVARPAYRIPDRFHRDYDRLLSARGLPHSPEPGAKLWLSRSRVEPDFGLLNSEVLESHLARAGWQVSYPETQPIPDQIAQLARAERVAGEEGSALHMLIWLDQPHRLQVDVLARWSDRKSVKGNYDLIAARKGFAQTCHLLASERVVRQVRGKNARLAHDFSEHLDALQVPVAAMDLTNPADWLVSWAKGRPIVQLGWDGSTPPLVQTVHLVSTESGLDPRAVRAAGARLYEMTPAQAMDYGPSLPMDRALVWLVRPDDLDDAALADLAARAGPLVMPWSDAAAGRLATLSPRPQHRDDSGPSLLVLT